MVKIGLIIVPYDELETPLQTRNYMPAAIGVKSHGNEVLSLQSGRLIKGLRLFDMKRVYIWTEDETTCG